MFVAIIRVPLNEVAVFENISLDANLLIHKVVVIKTEKMIDFIQRPAPIAVICRDFAVDERDGRVDFQSSHVGDSFDLNFISVL